MLSLYHFLCTKMQRFFLCKEFAKYTQDYCNWSLKLSLTFKKIGWHLTNIHELWGTSDWCLPTLLLIVAVGHILVALYSTVYKRKSALVLQNSSCLQFGSVGSVERYRFLFSLYEQLVNWINLLNVLIICQANFKQYWIVKLDGGPCVSVLF